MRQLTSTDAAMLYMSRPHTPMHVLPINIYDPSSAPAGKVSFEQALSHLAGRARLPRARTLRERLIEVPFGLDLPYWIEDPDFDLEFHVRHIALPKPGNWDQFMTQSARLHARPLDLARPPWELYVVDGLNDIPGIPEGAFATVIKVHHAAIDGVAGVELINIMHDLSSDPPLLDETSEPLQRETEPSSIELLARSLLNTVATPQRAIRAASRTAPVRRLRRQLRQVRLRPPSQPPSTRFNGPVSAHRVLGSTSVPLDDVKSARRAVPGATVNDVALSVVGGAARRYLAAKGEIPAQSLIAAVPVSVRPPGQASLGGNQISAMMAPLRTDVGDPVERLALIQKHTCEAKERRQAIDAHSLTELSESLPGALIGVGLRAISRVSARAPRVANMMVTNVPGPSVPLYFCGAKMIRGFGAGPVVDGMGLINLVGSYCSDFHFSFAACRQMMPDPSFYADCLSDSFDELSAAASKSSP